jgi:hypothetical protein
MYKKVIDYKTIIENCEKNGKTKNKKINLNIYLIGGYVEPSFLQLYPQKKLAYPWPLHFQIDL